MEGTPPVPRGRCAVPTGPRASVPASVEGVRVGVEVEGKPVVPRGRCAVSIGPRASLLTPVEGVRVGAPRCIRVVAEA